MALIIPSAATPMALSVSLGLVRGLKRRCPETDVEILNVDGVNVVLAFHGNSSNKCLKHIMG